MSKKAEIVFNGWLKLSETEKGEVLEEIRKYQGLTLSEKILKERKIVTGPLDSVCPCCGR